MIDEVANLFVSFASLMQMISVFLARQFITVCDLVRSEPHGIC